MKSLLCVFMFLLSCASAMAQRSTLDSLCANIDTRADDTAKVAAYFQLVGPYVNQNHDLAIGLFSRAYALSERLEFRSGMARSLTGMSLASSFAGHHQAGIKYADQAYSIAKELPIVRLRGNALNAKGVALIHADRKEEAISVLREALDVARACCDLRLEADVLTNHGNASYHLGRFNDAVESWERAIRIAEAQGDRVNAAVLLHNLGNVQTSPDRAIEYYRRSLGYHQKFGDKYNESKLLNQIGVNQMELERLDEAMATLDRAYAIAVELQNKKMLSVVATNLGNVHMRRGDAGQAMMRFFEAMNIAEAYQDRTTLATCLVNLAKLYKCGLVLGGGNETALEYAGKAIRAAEEIQDRHIQQYAYQYASAVHKCRGDFEQALLYHQLASTARDSLYNEKNLAKINELSMRYDADRRERELRELENRQQLQQLELVRRTLEARESAHRARLLTQQNAIKDLELGARARLLALNRAESETRRKQLALVSSDRALKASVADRASWQRNSIAGVMFLLGVLAFITWRHGNARRQAERLRAEAAESAARAAEYKATAAEHLAEAAQAQIERAEKEAQRSLAVRVMELQEQERNRIATDLHDSLGHGLLVIKNSAFIARRNPDLPEALREQLSLITDTATSVLHDVRKISHNLRPVHLDRTGLSDALRSSLQALGESTGVAFGGEIDEIDGLLDRTAEMNLFRIVQEGANNIVRHAAATEATLRVMREDGALSITIGDNGRGFDTGDKANHGFGLTGMEDRVRLLGGTMSIDSTQHRGTRIFIRLPLPDSQPATELRVRHQLAMLENEQ